jgi:transposase-like protein
LIADGHLDIWSALRNIYSETLEQRCWNHRILYGLDKLPRRMHEEAKPLLCTILYAETRGEAAAAKQRFARWCRTRHQPAAAEVLDRDWDRMITFYQLPHAPIVDRHRCIRRARAGEKRSLLGGCEHAQTLCRSNKKPDRFGSAPQARGLPVFT